MTAQADASLPADLVVDLDHTLVNTDTLAEQFVALVFRRPIEALKVAATLFKGRAAMKARLARAGALDAATLPVSEPLMAYLRGQRDTGRRLHLVTAADQSIADAVAQHTGVFTSAEGSDGALNLKGSRKAERLAERFPGGFAYAGDSPADLKVWAGAKSVVVAGRRAGIARRAQRLGKPIEGVFPAPGPSLKTWLKAVRIHQWSKNVLIFVPVLMSKKYLEPQALVLSLIAFVALGMVASATYLVNDLSDLAADRRHHKKRSRPMAAGRIYIHEAVIGGACLLAGAIVLGSFLPVVARLGICAYAALTLTYTFRLKRLPLFDALTLAALYALRIAIGASAVTAVQSPWLLTFAMFVFFSISLAKRSAEINNQVTAGGPQELAGRGYQTRDGPVVLGLGISASVASTLILVLYLTEEAFPSNLYREPYWLWVAPVVLTAWTARVWLLAGRGELDEDPISFALRDRVSWILAAPLVAAFVLATI